MDDLISRDEACNAISKMIHEYRENGEDTVADGMILAMRYGIKRLPAVDAVPVVRCRDCKYSIENAKHIDLACEWSYDYPDFYCAAGEQNDA